MVISAPTHHMRVMPSPIRANGCNITKEELTARNYNVFVNCPLCWICCGMPSRKSSNIRSTNRQVSLLVRRSKHYSHISFTLLIVIDDFKRISCGEMRLCWFQCQLDRNSQHCSFSHSLFIKKSILWWMLYFWHLIPSSWNS